MRARGTMTEMDKKKKRGMVSNLHPSSRLYLAEPRSEFDTFVKISTCRVPQNSSDHMDPGTALAILSLGLQVFDGCIKAFTLLSDSHSFGEDASLHHTLLSLEEYRFLSWAHAVKLDEQPWQPDPALNQHLAAQLMGQLERLLSLDTLRKRYKFEILEKPSTEHHGGTAEDGKGEQGFSTVRNILGQPIARKARRDMMARSKSLQSNNMLIKRIWWAAVDADRFRELVRNVRDIVDGLWKLLDPVQRQKNDRIMMDQLQTVIQVSKDTKELLDLQRAFAAIGGGVQSDPGDQTMQTHGEFSLEMLARLRRSRVESQTIEDGKLDIKSTTTPESEQPSTADSGAAAKPKPQVLQLELLTDVRRPSSGSITVGRYENMPVIIETKKVARRMKPKLVQRVRALVKLLSDPSSSSLSALRCLGYIELSEEFLLLFQYPEQTCTCPAGQSGGMENGTASQVSGVLQDPVSLLDIIRGTAKQKPLPSVTARVHIALQISRILLALHIAGWLHKDLRSENVLFFPNCQHQQPEPPESSLLKLLNPQHGQLRIVGFTFSREDHPAAISEQPSSNPASDIYRHPDALGEPAVSFAKHMDRYSLGTVMIELALWQQFRHIVYKCVKVGSDGGGDVALEDIAKVRDWLGMNVLGGEIAYRMGDVYASAARFCVLDADGVVCDGHDRDDVQEVEVLRGLARDLEQIQI